MKMWDWLMSGKPLDPDLELDDFSGGGGGGLTLEEVRALYPRESELVTSPYGRDPYDEFDGGEMWRTHA